MPLDSLNLINSFSLQTLTVWTYTHMVLLLKIILPVHDKNKEETLSVQLNGTFDYTCQGSLEQTHMLYLDATSWNF